VAEDIQQADDAQVSDDDEAKLVVAMDHTMTACAGAATAFVLRRIAACAGSYAPGIDEKLFFALTMDRYGASLELVDRWIAAYRDELQRLGYRFMFRRVAFRTGGIQNWVAAGKGYRGAVIPTVGKRLYPDLDIERRRHAVALTVHPDDGALTMDDPWPGKNSTSPPPSELEPAHRERRYAGLLLFWSGWS
jgi:hypothetical protein